MSLPRPGSKASTRTLESIRRDPQHTAVSEQALGVDDEAALLDELHQQQTASAAHDDQPPPPPKPFFALIADNSNPTVPDHHTPSVHYIFSDDDTDIIAEAALRALDDNADYEYDGSTATNRGKDKVRSPPYHGDEEGYHDDGKRSSLPPTKAGVREHYLVLDIGIAGNKLPDVTQAIDPSISSQQHIQSTFGTPPYASSISSLRPRTSSAATAKPSPPPQPQTYTYSITSSTSLSSTWQILNTELSAAPTMDPGQSLGAGSAADLALGTSPDDPMQQRQRQKFTVTVDPDAVAEQPGLMLKIDGIGSAAFRSGNPLGKGKGRNRAGSVGEGGASGDSGLEQLTKLFESRMRDLGRVVEAAREADEHAQEKEKVKGDETATEHDKDIEASGPVADAGAEQGNPEPNTA